MTGHSFPLNQWYVAAKSAEVTRTPLARFICSEPLVLFRRQDGRLAVLEDRCPHRLHPLSTGEVRGDDIECGYHGMRFDGTGRCTHIPAQKTIPDRFAVRTFPAIERSGLVHVWPGDPAKVRPELIPDFPENVAAGWTAVHGYRLVEANWQLVVDNLLDLTHLTFVHPTTLAGPGILENPLVVTVDGDIVRARREMPNVAPAPIFRSMRSFAGNIDRYQHITFLPPNHVHIRIEAKPAGVADDPDRVHHVVINHLTPETERTTHYFWSVARRMALDDEEVSRRLHEMNAFAFEEDAVVLKRQQEMIERGRPGVPLTNMETDKAISAARRIVRRLIAEEAGEKAV